MARQGFCCAIRLLQRRIIMPFLLDIDNRPSKKNTTRVVCALAFVVFSFTYLFFYQSEVLAAGQHVLSGGQTHYERLIGAILITLALYLLQLLVAHFVQLKKRAHAMTYFPSLFILTIITDVSPNIDLGFSLGGWWVAIPILTIVYSMCVWMLKQIEPFEPEPLSEGLLSRTTWINLLAMVFMFLAVGVFSNGDEVFHYRMKMEKLIQQGKYEAALNVGKSSLATDPSLTMLRAHALAKKQQLGNRFFHYPVPPHLSSLLPNDSNSRTVLLHDSIVSGFASKGWARVDYKLLELLLERELESFSTIVRKVYPDSLMPRHYAEALIQYQYFSGKPMAENVDRVVETDFHDFRKMEMEYPKEIAPNYLRRTFGNTYWYYYKYGGK